MIARSGHLLRAYWLEVLMVLPLTLYIGAAHLRARSSRRSGSSFTDRYSGSFPTLSNYEYIVSRPDFRAAFVNTHRHHRHRRHAGDDGRPDPGADARAGVSRARPLPHHHPDPDGRPDAGGRRRDALLLPHQRLPERAAAPPRADLSARSTGPRAASEGCSPSPSPTCGRSRRSSCCCCWRASNRSRATSTRRPTSTARRAGRRSASVTLPLLMPSITMALIAAGHRRLPHLRRRDGDGLALDPGDVDLRLHQLFRLSGPVLRRRPPPPSCC